MSVDINIFCSTGGVVLESGLAYKAQRIKAVRQKLKEFFNAMVQYYGGDDIILELMALRGYRSKKMYLTLKEIGVYHAPSLHHIKSVLPQFSMQDLEDFGLVTSEGDYFMTDRYVLPIKDIEGNIISLVGWDKNGGSRKYLTATSLGFYRDTSFFNNNVALRAWNERKGIIVLVEGIFDALALTSVGFPAIAAMGLELSHLKEILLSRFSAVIVIADNDKGGWSVNPFTFTSIKGISYLTEREKLEKVWKPETNTTFVVLPNGIKDADEFVRDYAMEEDMERLYNIDYHLSSTLFVQLS